MSKVEDDKITDIMTSHSVWERQFRALCYETLDGWCENNDYVAPRNKYALALELMENSTFFCGNDPDFDPKDKIHRDWLLCWCDEWLDKSKLHS